MIRALLTAFEPFGGEAVNSSVPAVAAVAAAPPPGIELHTATLSCVFGLAAEELRAEIARLGPDLVVCVGQAGGRAGLTIERVAVNLDDARIPDNAGQQPIDRPIAAEGPAAYFSRLPVKACTAAARAVGVPASVSHSAGTFVCNHVFYGLMHLIATRYPAMRGGFVHLPYAPEQVLDRFDPCLPVDAAAGGLRAVLAAAASGHRDAVLPGGALH